MKGVMWDNKKGWSIPRHAIDDVPMIILSCAATLEGREHYSTNYLIHPIGKTRNHLEQHEALIPHMDLLPL